MSDGAAREMTLDEFVDTLGPQHRARRELIALHARVEELEAERDEMARIAGKALREIIALAGKQPQHKWDRAGERCEICGMKDWMDGPHCQPPEGGQ